MWLIILTCTSSFLVEQSASRVISGYQAARTTSCKGLGSIEDLCFQVRDYDAAGGLLNQIDCAVWQQEWVVNSQAVGMDVTRYGT